MEIFEKAERLKNVITTILIQNGYDPITDSYIQSVGKCERKGCGRWNINQGQLGTEKREVNRCSGCGSILIEIPKEKYIKKYHIKKYPIIISNA